MARLQKESKMWTPPPSKYGETEKTQRGVRFPKQLLEWADKEADELGVNFSSLLTDALKLRQEMGALTPLRQKILRFALDENLEWPAQRGEVLRRLVERGLLAGERQERSQRR